MKGKLFSVVIKLTLDCQKYCDFYLEYQIFIFLYYIFNIYIFLNITTLFLTACIFLNSGFKNTVGSFQNDVEDLKESDAIERSSGLRRVYDSVKRNLFKRAREESESDSEQEETIGGSIVKLFQYVHLISKQWILNKKHVKYYA